MRFVNLAGASLKLPVSPAPFIYYRGYQLRETTGSGAALVRVWDNTVADGGAIILDEIALTSSQSSREDYGSPKVALVGVYVQIVSGSVSGSFMID